MSEAHRQAAGVIIQNDKGEILFLDQPKGRYGIPGGIVEPGETPIMAAIRETKEEIGVVVELEYIIGSYLLTGGGKSDNLATVYKATIVEGVPSVIDINEVTKILWRSPHDLPSPLVMDAGAAVEDLLAGKCGVVRIVERTGVMPTFQATQSGWQDV
jgi:8-oxo-dGTP diphosphatase